MANELYRTYEVLIEETVSVDHEKRKNTTKPSLWNAEVDGALRDTHMTFQDAVCYYTLLLAGLAGNGKNLSGNPLWAHLTGGLKEETEKVIRRLTTYYHLPDGIKTPEDFLEKIYSKPQTNKGKLLPAVYLLLEKFGIDKDKETDSPRKLKDMAQFASGQIRRLCDPKTGQADTTQGDRNENYFAGIKAKLKPENGTSSVNDTAISSGIKLEHCFMTSKGELSGEKALQDYLAAFGCESGGKKPTTIGRIEDKALLSAKESLIKEYGEFPKTQKGATQEQKQEIKKRQEAWEKKAKKFPLKSWSGKKPNQRLWFCLRYKWEKNEATRNALYELIKGCNSKQVAEGQTDEIAQWRSLLPNGSVPFPFFTKQLGLDNFLDFDFDKAAFAAAAEDVFKYKIRTLEREKKVRKLLKVVQAYEASEQKTLDVDDSPTGKKLTIRGMKDDPRWKGEQTNGNKGIEKLLEEMKDDKDLDEYGLQEGTIGGWAELRKSLIKAYQKAKKENKAESEICEQLEEAVDSEQTANRQGFGSADFFHKLCESDYHHLWLPLPEALNRVKNFIPHYVSYAQWKEELRDLSAGNDGTGDNNEDVAVDVLTAKPISYTWPGLLNRHKKPSYRYYDFKAKLNETLTIRKLFRRNMNGGQPVYSLLEDQTVKLSARRLKRDKILNDQGKSINALWCPPLILEGKAEPTTDERPRAGKPKKDKDEKVTWPKGDMDVSFSLMAAPLPGDRWNEVTGVPSSEKIQPVHFTVSIPIDGDELKKLEKEGVYFAGGSLKGIDENDDKRRYFRWPIDIETDKTAAKEAEKKNTAGAGGRAEQQPKKKDVKLKELWCHFNGGFRVKKSRYSKAKEIKTIPDFHVLSVDLGNRFAAAFARLWIRADKNSEGRLISADDFKPAIKAEVTRTGTLRLQGEDAEIWEKVTDKNREYLGKKLGRKVGTTGSFEFVKEFYGNDGRGRFPDDEEYKAFKKLALRLVPEESLSLLGTDKMTYAELGGHLVSRLKRRVGRLRTLFNLVWRLCGDKEKDREGRYTIDRDPTLLPFHRRMVVETLARSAFPKRERPVGETEDRQDENLRLTLASQNQWQKLKGDGLLDSVKGTGEKDRRNKLEEAVKNTSIWKWAELSKDLKVQIREYCEGNDSLDKLLVNTIEFCLPLRGRHWGWDQKREARLHWDNKDEAHTPKILGMRGLSLKRLEQILNLRQRCQSFAKLEDRYYTKFLKKDFNPPDSIPRDQVPDVCPLLLERSNRLRDQRVYQTAHIILAEALGMELKNPAKVDNKGERKNEVDLHGEYQRRKDKNGKDCPRCSVIVLENLERYKTSQERTRAENSRLMKWAHRAIVEKLEDMCKPFGITIMLVDPAFSSRFDSRTGLPGVRVNSVSRGFEKEMPYCAWINQKNKNGKPTKLAEDIEKVAKMFEDNPSYQDQLIIAVEGGKEFLPVNGTEKDKWNADINAAINIGYRAVADPQRWDIFPRLRTKEIADGEVQVLNWRGVFGKYGKDAHERRLIAANGMNKGNATTTAVESASGSGKKKEKRRGREENKANSIGESNDSEAGSDAGSSEFPPFFVQDANSSWMGNIEYFKPGDTICTIRAYPQGVFLKRAEQECGKCINEINSRRLEAWKEKARADTKTPR